MAKTRLQEKYLSEAVKGLMDKFNYKNVMEIPKIEKLSSIWALAKRWQQQSSGICSSRPDRNLRSETCYHQSKKIHRSF